MACMNYVVAVHANREDGCTGRFWEGRFKSQALKDETALLVGLAYVDLNPVRAGVTRNLVGSDYTSIQDRIKTVKNNGRPPKRKPVLMGFQDGKDTSRIPFGFREYLDLVDWYGRHIRPDRKGYISKSNPKLLNALGVSPQQWILLIKEISRESSSMLDGLEKLEILERRKAERKAS